MVEHLKDENVALRENVHRVKTVTVHPVRVHKKPTGLRKDPSTTIWIASLFSVIWIVTATQN